jgi:hypothetical protein
VMQAEIPRELTFDSSDDVYTFKHGQVVARQSVLMEFQRQLTTLVTAFLNSKFRKRIRIDWKYCQRLCDLLRKGSNPIRFQKSKNPEAIAENIAIAYQFLGSSLTDQVDRSGARNVVVPQCFRPAEQWTDSSSALTRIQRHFVRLHDAAYAAGAYAHGSMGSQDFTGYSDIDLLLVLSESASHDAQALLQIRDVVGPVCREVYCYDVLQHHGVFLISEIDFDYYPEAYLPTEVLKNGSVLCGDQRLSLCVRDSHFDAIRSYLMTTSMLRSWVHNKEKLTNLDRIKRFNSNLLLLPCLYLETRGVFCYKRESFDLIAPFLSDAARLSLQVASRVRNQWTRTGLHYSCERMFIRTGLFPQYLIRAGFASTMDRLYVRRLLGNYDSSFWNSLKTLLQELDESYGLPIGGHATEA